MIISIPLIAYAVSQYDKDGFTIFPGKSAEYMFGYREGVAQAQNDVNHFEERGGVDAQLEHIECPANSNLNLTGDACQGYKDGYADRAIDELE
jgi:hypothetical protein